MVQEVSGRAAPEAALSPLATEPVPVSALSGNDQPRVSFIWSRKLETSHEIPRPARDCGTDERSGKRLVQIRGDFETECLRTNPQYEGVTTWRYEQDGTIDGDKTGDWRLREAR